MRAEWRALRCLPESSQRICRKVTGADGGRRGPPGWLESLSSLSLSAQLLEHGGGGKLIIEAVKPSHSLVSRSNEVPAIKAL